MDALPDGRLIHVDYRRMVCLLARAIGRRPADSFGLLVVSVATVAVLMNALWLQPRPHPAPILAMTPPPKPVAAASAPPRVRPTETDGARTEAAASARAAQIVGDIQRELSRRGFYDGPTDGIYGARTDAAIRDFADASGLKITEGPSAALLQKIVQTSLKIVHMPQAAGAARRDDPIGALLAPSKRVIAIQRALRDFGYGQLKPSGVLDLETMDAIKRFENAHKLPATGQISDRLVRELAGATGRPLE
jgi:peptidoglycan hydrolase-like protein with peptidoglycan-binding domain